MAFNEISKPGGLDVWDQSRSRTSIASRLTFENRRDYPSRRDRLLFFLGRDFCRDCRDAVEICQDAVEICREISTRKYKNPCTSWSRSRQTVEKRRNFQISTKFSISIEIFLVWTLMSRQNRDISISIETTSRQIETPRLRNKISAKNRNVSQNMRYRNKSKRRNKLKCRKRLKCHHNIKISQQKIISFLI